MGPWTANVDTQSANDIAIEQYPGAKKFSVNGVMNTTAECEVSPEVQVPNMHPTLPDLAKMYEFILIGDTTPPPGPKDCNEEPCEPWRQLPYTKHATPFQQLLAWTVIIILVVACTCGFHVLIKSQQASWKSCLTCGFCDQ